eukprot:1430097-Rhodomonas_salina.1
MVEGREAGAGRTREVLGRHVDLRAVCRHCVAVLRPRSAASEPAFAERVCVRRLLPCRQDAQHSRHARCSGSRTPLLCLPASHPPLRAPETPGSGQPDISTGLRFAW